jgi:hypothetical protein
LPAPPPLTIQIFNAATPLPAGTGDGTQLARIEEGTNLMMTHMRSGVRALAWYNLTIAALALFVASWYPLSGILWLAFIVTLIVTRKGAKKASFMERVGWLSLTYWGWILATLIVTVTYLAAAAKAVSDSQAAVKPFGLALLGVIALVSARRRVRRAAVIQADGVNARRYDLLFLWVFKSGSVWHLMNGICQQWIPLGPTRLLGGGEFLGTDDWRLVWYWLRGHAGKIVLKTPEDLDVKMAPKRGGETAYLETFVCHDRLWKLALDRLLNDAAIVLMNLSGLSDSNRGCLYEIGVLFDRVALSRVVFLIDKATDVGYVKQVMEDAWHRLDVNSVNRLGPAPVVWVVQVATLMAELDNTGGTQSGDGSKQAAAQLAARTEEVRRVVRLLCAALERSEIQSAFTRPEVG